MNRQSIQKKQLEDLPYDPFHPFKSSKLTVKARPKVKLSHHNKTDHNQSFNSYQLTEETVHGANKKKYQLDLSEITAKEEQQRSIELLSRRIKTERKNKLDIAKPKDLSVKIGRNDDMTMVNALLGKSKQANEQFTRRKKKGTMYIQDLWALPLTKKVIKANRLDDDVENKLKNNRLAVHNRILEIPTLNTIQLDDSWESLHSSRILLPNLVTPREEAETLANSKTSNNTKPHSNTAIVNMETPHTIRNYAYHLRSNINIPSKKRTETDEVKIIDSSKVPGTSLRSNLQTVDEKDNQNQKWLRPKYNLTSDTEEEPLNHTEDFSIEKSYNEYLLNNSRVSNIRSAGPKHLGNRKLIPQESSRSSRSRQMFGKKDGTDYFINLRVRSEPLVEQNIGDTERSGKSLRDRRKTKAFLDETNDQVSKLIDNCQSELSEKRDWTDVMGDWNRIFKNVDRVEEKKKKQVLYKKIEENERKNPKLMLRSFKNCNKRS